MRNARWFTAVAVALFATAASATNGMRMIGFGPVQNSMGGVSAAAALDAVTVVTNPAGITALAPRVDLGGTAFMPTVKYDAAWGSPGGSGIASQSSDRPTDIIPTLAAVYRVQDDLTLGFAALGTAGMGVEYPAGATGLYTMRTYSSYQNMRVAPAAAYRVTDQLSIGVAANLQYAMMSYEAGGMPKRDTAGALGIGGTIGLTYAVTKDVVLAAAYESKSTFQSFEFDVPSNTIMTPGGPYTAPGGKEKLSFDQPQVATVGASVKPVEGLLVAADVEWIDWASTNGKNQPSFDTAQSQTGYMPWNLDWSSQVVYKIGAQYLVPAVKGLAVRAGYNYGASPLNKDRAFENLAFPAIAEHHFTLGGGYDAGAFTVNVAAQYSPEAKLTGGNASQGIPAYQAKMSQLAFDLGFAYRF